MKINETVKQLELPMLVDVNAKTSSFREEGQPIGLDRSKKTEEASRQDQEIYEQISSNYFASIRKEA